MLDNFGVFRREEQMKAPELEILDGLRERYDAGVLVEDKGDVFNSDLTQALELDNLIDLARVMVYAGVERKESRGAHARPYDYPDRDDEQLPEALDRRAGGTAPRLSTGRTCDDEVAAARSGSTDGAPAACRSSRCARRRSLAGCGGSGSSLQISATR